MWCTECGAELTIEEDEGLCGFCYKKLGKEQEQDHRLDDPRHGQAEGINCANKGGMFTYGVS